MNRPPSHWADSDLAQPFERMLESAESGAADHAALKRMSARLETALGAAFDARPAGRVAWYRSLSQLRRFAAIGVISIAAVGITVPSQDHDSTPRAHISSSAPQLTAAALRPAAQPAHDMTALEPPAATPESATPTSQHAAQTPVRKHRSQPSSAAAGPGLAEELSGLAQIRALLETSPERALAAVNEQQQRFAHGALTPERALLRLDALVLLSHATQARRLAAQLMAAPENQPYTARIAALLAQLH